MATRLEAIKRLTIEGRVNGIDAVVAAYEQVDAAQKATARSADVVAVATETSARRVVSSAQQWTKLTDAMSGNTRAAKEYERGMRTVLQAEQQGLASAEELARARMLLQQTYQSAPIRGPQIDQASLNNILGIRDTFAGAARSSAEAFSRELDRLDEIAAQKAQQAGETFRNGLNRSFNLGASATANGATFSALEDQMKRMEEIDRLRAVQVAATSQQGFADRFGYDRGAGSARSSASVFEEDARMQREMAVALSAAFEEDAKSAAAFASRLVAVRAEIDPLAAAQLKLNAELAEYRNLASQPGGLSFDEEAKAIRRATAEYDAFERRQNARSGGLDYTNLSYQANDAITMALMGAGPGQILASQGGQIFQSFQTAEGGLKGGLQTLKTDIAAAATAAASFLGPGGAIVLGLTVAAGAAVAFGRSAEDNLERANEAAKQYSETLRRVSVGQNDLASGIQLAAERAGRMSPMQSRAAIDAELARQRDALQASQTSFAQTAIEGVSGSWDPTAVLFELYRRQMGQTNTRDLVELAEQLRVSADNAEDVRAKLDIMRADPNLATPVKELVDQLSKSADAAILARNTIKGLEDGLRTMRVSLAQGRVTDAADAFREFLPRPDRTQEEEVRRQTQIRIAAADALERASGNHRQADAMRLAAINDEKKALGELSRQQGEVRKERELSLQLIGNPTVQQRAEVAYSQAMIGADATGADRGEFMEAGQAAQVQIYAQAVADATEAERQASVARSQAGLDSYAAGLASINASYARQIELADGSAESIARLTRARDLENETFQINQRKQLLDPQQESLRGLNALAETIGMSDDAARRVLAVREAENRLIQQGINLNTEMGRGYAANALKMSDYGDAIRRQGEAWDDVRRAGESAIDGVFGKLSSDDWKGALKGIGDDLTKTFTELAVTNPLKNSLLGTSYGTLDDLMAGKPIAPKLDMPAMPSVANATISVGVANFTGGAFNGLPGSSVERHSLPALNDNGKGDRILDHASARVAGAFDLTSISDAAVANTLRLHPERAAVAQYYADGALARGLNPEITLRGLNQESGFNLNARNLSNREQSYGVAQLNTMGGLGAVALNQGIDVRDNATWRQQADFALDTMQKDGYRQWYGFRDVGIGRWDGRDRDAGSSGAAKAVTQLGETSTALAQNATQFQTNFAATLNDSLIGSMGSAVDQFAPGFGGVLQNLLNAVGQSSGGAGGLGGLIASAFGGGGSIFSTPESIMAAAKLPGMFADGGFTGHGGVHQPAGVVHRGEIVWSQRDIARAGGVGTVEAMRLGMRGYADGGYVGGAEPRIPANANPLPAANANGPRVVINDMRTTRGAEPVETRETQDEFGRPQIEVMVRDITRDETLSPSRRTARGLKSMGVKPPTISR